MQLPASAYVCILFVHQCTPDHGENASSLAGCLSVRNRNLMVLARSKLRLASLTIGNTTTNVLGKPRITNQARAAGGARRSCTPCNLEDSSFVLRMPCQVILIHRAWIHRVNL